MTPQAAPDPRAVAAGTGTPTRPSPPRPAATASVPVPAVVPVRLADAPLSPKAGQRARWTITAAGTAVIATSFVFSFGNITALGKVMGLGWLAYPLAPAVDLTVLALVWGIRYASLSNIDAARLRPARRLLLAAGLGTWGLNTAAAWSNHNHGPNLGKVALDSIAPALLVAWAEIGPWFLRLFVEIRQREQAAAASETTSHDRPSTTRAVPPRRSRSSSRPPARGRRAAQTGSRRDEMVAWVLAERAAGRDPTGADVDAKFDTRDYGRRVLREEPALNGHLPEAGSSWSA